jgi:hypothetical protein
MKPKANNRVYIIAEERVINAQELGL